TTSTTVIYSLSLHALFRSDEAFLHRVQLAVLRQAFHGGDVVSVYHDGQSQARTDHVTVHQHGAGAAYPDTAAFFCAGQAKIVARSAEHTSELQSLAYLVCR